MKMLPAVEYDDQDTQNLLLGWLDMVRSEPGTRTVAFSQIEAEAGVDAGTARDHLPELLKEDGIEVLGLGSETVRFVVKAPKLEWGSAGRRSSAKLLEDF